MIGSTFHYIKGVNDDLEIISNFKLKEFICHDPELTEQIIILDTRVLMNLSVIRRSCNSPVVIASCWRSIEWNRKIGGIKNSQHLYGEAVDIYLPDNSKDKLIGCCRIFPTVVVNEEKKYIHCAIKRERDYAHN
jgi:uncharacterized protein YcbK (DUF882 family)